MSILVDTGAWYALADTSDLHHKEAKWFYSGDALSSDLVTTDLIVAESFSLFSSHLSRKAALTFWESLRAAQISILSMEAVDLEAAWRIAQSYPDQRFSFVDCTSFAVMERFGIQDVFAFDDHFLVYRFGPTRQRSFHRLPH